jgi:hypothetical protein
MTCTDNDVLMETWEETRAWRRATRDDLLAKRLAVRRAERYRIRSVLHERISEQFSELRLAAIGFLLAVQERDRPQRPRAGVSDAWRCGCSAGRRAKAAAAGILEVASTHEARTWAVEYSGSNRAGRGRTDGPPCTPAGLRRGRLPSRLRRRVLRPHAGHHEAQGADHRRRLRARASRNHLSAVARHSPRRNCDGGGVGTFQISGHAVEPCDEWYCQGSAASHLHRVSCTN